MRHITSRVTTALGVGVLTALLLVACGGDPSAAAQAASEVDCGEVSPAQDIEVFVGFSPEESTISSGDVVRWYAAEDEVTTHKITEWDGAFESDEFGAGGEYCVEFPESGEVEFYCEPHGLERKGTVTVE